MTEAACGPGVRKLCPLILSGGMSLPQMMAFTLTDDACSAGSLLNGGAQPHVSSGAPTSRYRLEMPEARGLWHPNRQRNFCCRCLSLLGAAPQAV
jgi:hypothetical protein